MATPKSKGASARRKTPASTTKPSARKPGAKPVGRVKHATTRKAVVVPAAEPVLTYALKGTFVGTPDPSAEFTMPIPPGALDTGLARVAAMADGWPDGSAILKTQEQEAADSPLLAKHVSLFMEAVWADDHSTASTYMQEIVARSFLGGFLQGCDTKYFIDLRNAGPIPPRKREAAPGLLWLSKEDLELGFRLEDEYEGEADGLQTLDEVKTIRTIPEYDAMLWVHLQNMQDATAEKTRKEIDDSRAWYEAQHVRRAFRAGFLSGRGTKLEPRPAPRPDPEPETSSAQISEITPPPPGVLPLFSTESLDEGFNVVENDDVLVATAHALQAAKSFQDTLAELLGSLERSGWTRGTDGEEGPKFNVALFAAKCVDATNHILDMRKYSEVLNAVRGEAGIGAFSFAEGVFLPPIPLEGIELGLKLVALEERHDNDGAQGFSLELVKQLENSAMLARAVAELREDLSQTSVPDAQAYQYQRFAARMLRGGFLAALEHLRSQVGSWNPRKH